MARIIVVEDDIGQQEELLSFLEYAKHEVSGAAGGEELRNCLAQFTPEIVLLDYNLPGETGAALAAWLRQEFGTSVGIVMVTARGTGNDRIECRLAGVDDYLVKPVEFGELLALIENLFARLTPAKPLVESWQLIVAHSELHPPNTPPIQLTAWEVSLLAAIADAPEQIAYRNDLIRTLGKDPDQYDPRALEATISRLRRKLPLLDGNHNPLESVRNIGYRFVRQLIVVR